MAQLDALIGALLKHKGEALVLAGGEKPSLILAGARRPIVNAPLSAAQVTRLLAEIVPPSQGAALAAGAAVSFVYATDTARVAVEAPAGGPVMIRVADAAAAPAPPAAADPGPASGVSATAAGRGSPPAVPAEGIDELFRAMVDAGASDLHLSCGAAPLLRVDGEMQAMAGRPVLRPEILSGLLRPITPETNWEEFGRDGDTDFAYEIKGLCRFRCNLFRDRKGPGAVFRVIPSEILTADDLGLSREIRNLCYLTKGLVLVTGPTGSGKSTTLTALIDLINAKRADHVITIEDPIEFVHDNKRCLINQREVGVHTKGFKRALRAALREDPDIVLVGEMRDLETIAIAMETAETGHLVFGTLHTSSAISTVDRLIDQFPADQQPQIRVMLAESLKAVIAQVLCRKKGGGRVAALEVLMAVPAIANLIREGKTFQIHSMMQTGKKHGMVTMNDSLLKLVKDGIVEPEEAYTKAIDKANLLSAFQTHKIPVDFLESRPAAEVGTK